MATPALEELEPERLSLVDTAWLHMEMPTNLMMVGSLAFFDAPVDRNQLLTALDHRLLIHPRFRERVEVARLGPPKWVPDPMFDLNEHVRRIALPAPGGENELRGLLGDLMSTPLDMTRPLWDAHVIENYRGGSIVFTRIHHCIADGSALVQVLLSLSSTTAAGSLRAPRFERRGASTNGRLHLPSLDPRRAVGSLIELGTHAYTLARLSALWPDTPTPLRGKLVRSRKVAWTEPFPLESLRALRAETDYTVNDILVAAVSGALRTYIRRHNGGEVPDHVRAMVPVDMRPKAANGKLGNQFGLVFLDMPVGLANRFDRLEAVHARMDEARRSPQPSVALEVLGAMGLVPQVVQRQVVRFFGSKGTAVVTNVRGPDRPLYLAGRQLRNLTFFVPQSAMLGLGISIMTYAGNIQMGVIADSGLVPDPVTIARQIMREMRTLASS